MIRHNLSNVRKASTKLVIMSKGAYGLRGLLDFRNSNKISNAYVPFQVSLNSFLLLPKNFFNMESFIEFKLSILLLS